MNKVEMIGWIVKDPEVRYTNAQTAIAKLTLAVDRRHKKDGEQATDFISCVSFGKTAEFIEKYFRKGNRMGLCGRIQTGSYTNRDGQKVYTTDVVIEEVYFVEKSAKSRNDSSNRDNTNANDEGFMNIQDGPDESLPFI